MKEVMERELFGKEGICPHAMIKHNGRKLTIIERKVLTRFGNTRQTRAGRYYCKLTNTLCSGDCG